MVSSRNRDYTNIDSEFKNLFNVPQDLDSKIIAAGRPWISHSDKLDAIELAQNASVMAPHLPEPN